MLVLPSLAFPFRIQKRCLRAIGQDQEGVEDLDSRRKAMAFRLYEEICIQETIIKDLLPPSLSQVVGPLSFQVTHP